MSENSSQNTAPDPSQTLHSVFNEGLDLYNKICSSNEPTNSYEVQVDIKRAMKCLEQATRLVSLADIFSKNEHVDEVSTTNLQYFLLPALLGSLALKLTSGERKDVVDAAEVYFKDFLNRTNNYGLSNYKFKEGEQEIEHKVDSSDFEQLAIAVNTRANKIQRFKEHKELKEQLQSLKKNVENEHADEEIKRKYFLTMIKLFIYEVMDELNSIDMEKPILEHMANMKKDDKPKPKREPPPPLKPVIITKDAVQKAVYGAGYPSLPIFTVDEFYAKRVADGIFPDPNKKKTGPLSIQEAALAGVSLNDDDKEEQEKEQKEEADDEEQLAKMRAMDEYKDDHRRGWGNRMNRS